MDTAQILLDEWRENVTACIEGKDPLLEPRGMTDYMARFPHREGYRDGWKDFEPHG